MSGSGGLVSGVNDPKTPCVACGSTENGTCPEYRNLRPHPRPPEYTSPMKVGNSGKIRLGWRYWPTVYFWAMMNRFHAWWAMMNTRGCSGCEYGALVDRYDVTCPWCGETK